MGSTAEGDSEIRERLTAERVRTMVEAYELGSEDAYDDGYATGSEDVYDDGYATGSREELDNVRESGCVVRWIDNEVYAWNSTAMRWYHAPHRWLEVLNS